MVCGTCKERDVDYKVSSTITPLADPLATEIVSEAFFCLFCLHRIGGVIDEEQLNIGFEVNATDSLAIKILKGKVPH